MASALVQHVCQCEVVHKPGCLAAEMVGCKCSKVASYHRDECEAATSDLRVMPSVEPRASRRVDPGPWLDGSYVPPRPTVGAIRDDGATMLYPGRWHSVVGMTESGKSWLAVAHVRDVLINGTGSVVYVHFEEPEMGDTIDRLRAVGVPVELIRERFVWLDNDRMWERGDLTAELAAYGPVTLVVLDGQNAACEQHGKNPSQPEAVGWFRDRFVNPAMRSGAAALSLGHPVKAPDRQGERHGFGYTGWLDQVNGVAFRLTAAKGHPIRRGHAGTSALHVVKDRPGLVKPLGVLEPNQDGWYYVGSLVVDDTGTGTRIRISTPSRDQFDQAAGATPDAVDDLAAKVEALLLGEPDRRYESERRLEERLRARRVKFSRDDLPVALERLEEAGRLIRGPYVLRRSRPGWLPADGDTALIPDPEQDHPTDEFSLVSPEPTDPPPSGAADHGSGGSGGLTADPGTSADQTDQTDQTEATEAGKEVEKLPGRSAATS